MVDLGYDVQDRGRTDDRGVDATRESHTVIEKGGLTLPAQVFAEDLRG